MSNAKTSQAFTPNRTVFILLAFLAVSAYSNTFKASWHFDDFPNITENKALHLNQLDTAAIVNTFYAHPSSKTKQLYRPIACLTFGLNWYWGQESVRGYHVVNTAIHIFAAFWVYLIIINLFQTPRLAGCYTGNERFIALLGAALWILNPIHTQAVTYIVQRMTSLAAMFYLLSLYAYVKGRLTPFASAKVMFFALCSVGFLIAFGSKENAITLPLALLLVEVVFFRSAGFFKQKNNFYLIGIVLAVVALILGSVIFLSQDPFSILNGYKTRLFTPTQRLLTEPRIIVFYLSQIFYPIPNRLSIEHDVNISTSLFQPWTTLPAILLIALLIGIGCLQINKRPLFAFAIFFYFLNHLVESTIIPLELVFEHRNYLPSAFLFFPIAAALKSLLDHYADRKTMRLVLIAFITLLLAGLGSGTYIRNMAWASEISLWEDAHKKAPGRARPLNTLAKYYYRMKGRSAEAAALYRKALYLQDASPKKSQAISLTGIGHYYYTARAYAEVIALCERALMLAPGFEAARFNMVLALMQMGRWQEASQHLDRLILHQKDHRIYLRFKGLILLNLGKPKEALLYLRKVLRLNPLDKTGLEYIGRAFQLMQRYVQAEWFFRRANQIPPKDDIVSLFALIENALRRKDPYAAERYLLRLLALFSIQSIQTHLEQLNTKQASLFVSRELLTAAIAKKLAEKSILIRTRVN